jgi:hypothetical protein
MSEVYSNWYLFKIPLSPFVKGGTDKGLEWFQHNSCNKKGCQGGFYTVARTSQLERIYGNSEHLL